MGFLNGQDTPTSSNHAPNKEGTETICTHWRCCLASCSNHAPNKEGTETGTSCIAFATAFGSNHAPNKEGTETEDRAAKTRQTIEQFQSRAQQRGH